MSWKTGKSYRDLKNDDPVRFLGTEGRVFKTDYYERSVSSAHVAVVFSDATLIHHIHEEAIEVWEEPAPEPKKPEYRETDYYVETLTGAIYKRQFSSDCHWYLICANQIKPSIPVTGCASSIPKNFKRLYREA